MTIFLEIFPDLLRGSITAISILLLLPILSKTKINPKTHAWIVLSVVVVDLMICIPFYYTKNYTFVLYYSLFSYLMIIFGYQFILKDRLYQWLFNSVTVLIIYAMVVISSYFISRVFPYPAYVNTIIRILFFSITIVIVKKIIRPLYLDVSENWGAFLLPITGILISYLYILLSLGEIQSSMQANMIYFYLLCLITLLEYSAIIFSLKSLRTKYQFREENIKRQANELLLRSEIESYESTLNAAKQTRHDIRHHNSILLEYLNRGEVESALHYLKLYDDNIKEHSIKDYSKNPIANAVFRIYDRRSKEYHIVFKVQSEADHLLNNQLPDLGVVLSNLLENAFIAAKNCMFDDRYITYKSCLENESILIEIVNSMEGFVEFTDGLPITTKTGGGTGAISVKHIVQKYGGMVEFKQNKSEFSTRIIFPKQN